MDSVRQVIFVFEVALLIAPLSVYFIMLGLLNSQPTPRLINARSDFLMVTAAVTPFVLAPIPSLIRNGSAWVLIPAAAIALLSLRFLLPRPNSGWVVYNLSRQRAGMVLRRCLDDLGWRYTGSGDQVELPEHGARIRMTGLPILRNISYHLEYSPDCDVAGLFGRLHRAMSSRLGHQQMLPSVAGSCLMFVGLGMLLLPLWLMTRHSNAIAEVVSRLLLS